MALIVRCQTDVTRKALSGYRIGGRAYVWFTDPAYGKQVGQGFVEWSEFEDVANVLWDGKGPNRLIVELPFSTSYPSGYPRVLAK
jgi:hypothetical protein